LIVLGSTQSLELGSEDIALAQNAWMLASQAPWKVAIRVLQTRE
jgi:hypothetical protein